jgi:hypothetical protein
MEFNMMTMQEIRDSILEDVKFLSDSEIREYASIYFLIQEELPREELLDKMVAIEQNNYVR